jgi:hypothetical protein
MDRRYTAPSEGLSSSRFVTVSSPDFGQFASLWDQIIRAPEKEQIVVRALQILEPSSEDIRFTSQRTAGGVFVKLRHLPNRVTLSSLGEGMRRILALILSAVTMEHGVLLIDEIDTGLYHRAQTDMWRLLIETAQRLNVQIFATTHSWDCVEAFQEALAEQAEQSPGRLFRLEEWQGGIRAVLYDAEDLAVVIRQAIEVR